MDCIVLDCIGEIFFQTFEAVGNYLENQEAAEVPETGSM